MVELLIEHKSDVDHQTKTGCTPLMEATRYLFQFCPNLILHVLANIYSVLGISKFSKFKR